MVVAEVVTPCRLFSLLLHLVEDHHKQRRHAHHRVSALQRVLLHPLKLIPLQNVLIKQILMGLLQTFHILPHLFIDRVMGEVGVDFLHTEVGIVFPLNPE
jgi:hypothetical protein